MSRLLQRGNSKLQPNILTFNIPASKAICGRTCPGCYAYKAYRIYPNVLPAQESRYQASLQPDFVKRITTELSRVRKSFDYVRIHASAGEFYSQQYIDSWHSIASAHPHITFYAYTKRLADFDFSALLALPNFILINSLQFGALNYGPANTAPSGAFVCPASATVHCGTSCTYCMSKPAQHNGVWFNAH